MRRLGICAVATIAAGEAFAAPPVGAAEWLVRSSAAGDQATYMGVVIFRSEHAMEVLRVAHRRKDGHIQERLTSLTGSPRDILREDDDVALLMPSAASEEPVGAPGNLFPPVSAELLARAVEHYSVREAGTARVAGRSCRSVALEPRDEFRYGYEVCADEATAVPLEVSLRDREGRTVEQLMFTEVSFPARLDDAVFSGRRAAPRPAVPVAPAAAGLAPVTAAGWQLVKLPPGFRVIARQSAADGEGVEQLLLSDGLSAVSVFGVRTPAESTFHGASRLGAMNAYVRHVGSFHITVIGEVPAPTVRLIGDGFTAEDEPAR